MRISTGMIFDAGVRSINNQTASLLRLQQQVSSGRRILTPSDDPVAAARALEVTQSQDITAQFKQNHDNATSALGLEEAQLTSTGDLLARVRELTVQAGNSTLTSSDRLAITAELRSSFDQLTGIANATDGSGLYLFSGFMGATKPFSGTVQSILSGTAAKSTGARDISGGITVAVGSNTLSVSLDGAPAVNLILTTQTSGALVASTLNTTIAGSALAGKVQASLDASNHLVLTTIGTDALGAHKTLSVTGNALAPTVIGAQTPVAGEGGEIVYQGDNGQRKLQVSPTRFLDVSDSGNDVFKRIPNGNGYFVTNYPVNNAGAANNTAAAATIGLTAQASAAGTSITATFTSSTETSPLGDASFTFLTGASVAASNDNFFAATQTVAGLAALAAGGYTATQASAGGPVQFALAGTNPGTAFTVDFAGGAAGDVVALAPPGGAYTGGTVASDPTGSFVTGSTVTATAIRANLGTGIIDAGNITDPAKWNALPTKNYSISFSIDNTVAPPVTYYDIVSTVTGNSMLTGTAPVLPPTAVTGQRLYQSGQPINLRNQGAEPAFDFGGSVTITGNPSNGDSFTIAPSSSQSVFATLGKLIGALESTNTGTNNPRATLANDIGFALTNLDHAIDNILRVRAQIGSRMNEIDSLSSVNSDLNLQYQQTLSNLQDLDYAKAISDLTRKQTDLQAAQQSFAKVSQLSLFNYL